MRNIPANNDYDIELYQVKRRIWPLSDIYILIASSKRANNADEMMNSCTIDGVTYSYLPEGEYVIKIYSYKGVSSERYELKISFNGLDDEYENNDTLANAYPLPNSIYHTYDYRIFDTTIKGTIDRVDDVDYYKFTLTKDAAEIQITLDNIASNYIYELSLYRGGTLLAIGTPGAIQQTIVQQLKGGYTYYIKVHSNLGAHSTKYKYTLKIKGIEFSNQLNFKDSSNNYISNGIVWTYDEAASTYSDGYKALYRYSSSESYLYLYQKIYLYNFNIADLGYAIGALDKTIDILESNHNFLGTMGWDSWVSVGTFAYESIKKVYVNPYKFAVYLGYTTFRFFGEYTMTEYKINLLRYFSDRIKSVLDYHNYYRIEIEVYKRHGSNDEYIYIKFNGKADSFANPVYFDNVYSNYLVKGTLSYIGPDDNQYYLNKYIFDTDHNYKNNFNY